MWNKSVFQEIKKEYFFNFLTKYHIVAYKRTKTFGWQILVEGALWVIRGWCWFECLHLAPDTYNHTNIQNLFYTNQLFQMKNVNQKGKNGNYYCGPNNWMKFLPMTVHCGGGFRGWNSKPWAQSRDHKILTVIVQNCSWIFLAKSDLECKKTFEYF